MSTEKTAGEAVERAGAAFPVPLHWVCLLAGAAVWVLPGLRGREAWDMPSYFVVSLPFMAAVAGFAAWRAPARAWRWPLWVIGGQLAAALAFHGGGNLLPLGVIVFLILGAPLFIAAAVASRIARRKGETPG
jgi:hypothetical protein